LGLKEGLRGQLQGKLVALDTAPFIYFLEIFPKYSPLVDPFFEALERGEIYAVPSVLTLVEVLVHPIRKRNPELAGQYRQILLSSDHLRMAPVSLEVLVLDRLLDWSDGRRQLLFGRSSQRAERRGIMPRKPCDERLPKCKVRRRARKPAV
jgi:hypothetical protein